MANIVITGIPMHTRKHQVLFKLKREMMKQGIGNYWMLDYQPGRSNGMEATVEYVSAANAELAMQIFHEYPFYLGDNVYYLNSYMTGKEKATSVIPTQSLRKRKQRPVNSTISETTTDYDREVSKLDKEIELLRRQRKIVEEEKRLLLEKKKLELLRKSTHSTLEEFESSIPKRKRSQELKPHSIRLLERRDMPLFVQPVRILLQKMAKSLRLHLGKEYYILLVKLLKETIRKRIAKILDGKPHMKTKEILELYRQHHLLATDEELIDELLEKVQESSKISDEQVVATDDDEKLIADSNDTVIENDSNDIDEMAEDTCEDKTCNEYVSEDIIAEETKEDVIENEMDIKVDSIVSTKLEEEKIDIDITAGEELVTEQIEATN